MSLSYARIWLLCLLCTCPIVGASVDSAAISGTVRGADGHSLAYATVSLGGRSTHQARSDSSGHFHFTGLTPGDYTLSASLTGYIASGSQSIHLQSAPVNADIVLSRASSAPLEFQSSGIRGMIDPGGYSASTASASSGILRGIGNLKRTGNSFAAAKDWPCSLEPQLKQAVAQFPDHPESSLRLGQFYVARHQPALAIPPLQRALALNITNDAIPRALAAAWLEAGDFDAAHKVVTQALATRKTAELYELLARSDEGSGLFYQAAEDYRRAAALSASEESSFGIGYELLLSGSLAEASAAFAEGISRYPASVLIQIGAGTAHFLQGDSAVALSNFLTAAELDPADHRPYSFLTASAAVSSDQQDRVLTVFKHYLDIDPNSANANYFYALALSRVQPANDATRIEPFLERAIQLDPTLAHAHLQLADSYARRGHFGEAVPEYEATLRLDSDPGPRYRLALAYKRLGRADDSAREMQLFRDYREADWHPAAVPIIDLAQFISATNNPDSRFGPPLQCPTSPP